MIFIKKKNNEYLKKNMNRYLKDVFIKLKFIFFGINRDGSLPDKNGKFNNDIRISQILSKISLMSSPSTNTASPCNAAINQFPKVVLPAPGCPVNQ